MFSKLKSIFRRLFKKRLKPVRKPKEIELVAGGFIDAPDYMCVDLKKTKTQNSQ